MLNSDSPEFASATTSALEERMATQGECCHGGGHISRIQAISGPQKNM